MLKAGLAPLVVAGLFYASPSLAACPLDLRAPVPWAGTPWSADAALLCDLYAARDALAAVRAEQRRGRAAGVCTRAQALAGGAIAPCGGELLPSTAVQSLLEDHAALALARAEWAAERTGRGADVLRLTTERDDAVARWQAAEAAAVEPVVVTRETGASWWAVVAVGAGALVVGFVVGAAAL